MRYLLIIIAVIEFLLGAAIIVAVATQGLNPWGYADGALILLAGVFGMRVGVRGRGHLGVVIFNGIILAVILFSLYHQAGQRWSAIPWLKVDTILKLAIPGLPILLSLVVGRPKHDRD